LLYKEAINDCVLAINKDKCLISSILLCKYTLIGFHLQNHQIKQLQLKEGITEGSTLSELKAY